MVTVAFGQEPTRRNRIKITSEYNHIKYDIINIDTIVIHFVDGKYNSPDFKRWDSTEVWADIILNNAPAKIDSVILKQQIIAIMKRHGIVKASAFRDEHSSMLARLSSLYAYRKLIEGKGYFGNFTLY